MLLSLSENLYCCFHIHHQLMFGYIFRLHSAILVSNYSFIVLVSILLFQNYSYQICNLLFLILCQHNRLRPRHVAMVNFRLQLIAVTDRHLDPYAWSDHETMHPFAFSVTVSPIAAAILPIAQSLNISYCKLNLLQK